MSEIETSNEEETPKFQFQTVNINSSISVSVYVHNCFWLTNESLILDMYLILWKKNYTYFSNILIIRYFNNNK